MILVFGGTTEGKQVISMLNALERSFVYSTKTKTSTCVGDFGTSIYGAMTKGTLIQFIRDNDINVIIHAAHPFAENLHRTIDLTAKEVNVPVWRLERSYPERTISKNVMYLDNYVELLDKLNQNFKTKNLLALTGVQSIPKLSEFWKKTKSYFRILNRASSIGIASRSEFPMKQLILEEPQDLVGNEEVLIRKYNIQVIATKESGDTGALGSKIQIAVKNDIPILILKKPKLPNSFEVVKNVEELEGIILNETNNCE